MVYSDILELSERCNGDGRHLEDKMQKLEKRGCVALNHTLREKFKATYYIPIVLDYAGRGT